MCKLKLMQREYKSKSFCNTIFSYQNLFLENTGLLMKIIFHECNIKMKKSVSWTFKQCTSIEWYNLPSHFILGTKIIWLSWVDKALYYLPWIHLEDIFYRIHWFPIHRPYSPTLLSTLHSSLVKVLDWLTEEQSGQLPKKENKLINIINISLALIHIWIH